MGRRDTGPAAGVGVIFFVEHQVQVGEATWGQLVGGASNAFAVVGANQLNDAAGGDADRHVLELQGHIVVGLRGVQTQYGLLGLAQVQAVFTRFLDVSDATRLHGLARAAAHQAGLARDRIGLDAEHSLVVHSRLDPGRITHQHLVGAHEDFVTAGHQAGKQADGAEVEHRTPETGASHALFSQQVNIANRADLTRAIEFDVVVFRNRHRTNRDADAQQRNHRHVGPGLAQNDVGHTVTTLAGEQLHITADQLGSVEQDVVVGPQVHRGRGIGPANRRQREGVGAGHHVGLGAGRQHQVPAQVAQRSPGAHADVGDRVGLLRGFGNGHGQSRDAVDPHLVNQVDA